MSTFILHVKDDNRAHVLVNCITFISQLPDSKPWSIEIERYVKERSDAQNHALFGVAYPVLERETGFTKDELHEAFCKKVFGTVEKVIIGQIVSKPYRTTTRDDRGKRDVISTEDFSRFYLVVQQTAAEAGIYVPDPDPCHKDCNEK